LTNLFSFSSLRIRKLLEVWRQHVCDVSTGDEQFLWQKFPKS
jgi:hypothetical protein